MSPKEVQEVFGEPQRGAARGFRESQGGNL